jgi:hypothetical protein
MPSWRVGSGSMTVIGHEVGPTVMPTSCTRNACEDVLVMTGPDDLEASELHRSVLRRLIELSGEHRRLVTPSQLVADGWVAPGGDGCPGAVQSSYLRALDELVGHQLGERVVPTAGESSYRPTELGCQRLRQLEDDD